MIQNKKIALPWLGVLACIILAIEVFNPGIGDNFVRSKDMFGILIWTTIFGGPLVVFFWRWRNWLPVTDGKWANGKMVTIWSIIVYSILMIVCYLVGFSFLFLFDELMQRLDRKMVPGIVNAYYVVQFLLLFIAIRFYYRRWKRTDR